MKPSPLLFSLAFIFSVLSVRPALSQNLELKTAAAMTPAGVVESAVVTISHGRISGVVAGGRSETAIAVDGVMFPGLIDLHNHITWNVLPNWQPPRLFSNRYEWQETPEYALNLSGPYNAMIASGLGCDMNRFGEVKSLVNGGTTTVGSFGPTTSEPDRNRCIQGLARNVDFASELIGSGSINREPYRNVVFPFEIGGVDEELIRTVDPDSADQNRIHAAVMHLAEGTDSAARREFRQFRAHQFSRKGVTIVHGVALGADQIRELAHAGVGFVWSPHSNFNLYGKTADILTALDSGMTVAIAPDWSPTGSAGMLEELGVAYRYSLGTLGGAIPEASLVQMATINAARLANVEKELGSIEVGKLADLLVVRRHGKTAYQSLLIAGPGDVLLVTIGGVPVYGDRGLMERLVPQSALESITICGEPKALHLVDDLSSEQSWVQVSARLRALMKPLGLQPANLVSCSAVR